LYTMMEIGGGSKDFIMDIMRNTGVLFVPGSGFGETSKTGVRVSYGPLVDDTDRIREGMRRVGNYLNAKGQI
jgi:aspartate/methionine/tyrosine aminotransferase